MTEFSKPKITIDLDEYNHLKEIEKSDNKLLEDNFTKEEIEQLMGALISLTASQKSLEQICKEIRYRLRFDISLVQIGTGFPILKFEKIK